MEDVAGVEAEEEEAKDGRWGAKARELCRVKWRSRKAFPRRFKSIMSESDTALIIYTR